MFFGGIFCGLFSDIYGRRPFLLYSLAINAMAGVASAFAPGVDSLIICRVIGGVGIGGSVPAVFSLGAEMFAPAVRGKLLSIIASFWMVGAIFVAGAAWIMLGNDANGLKIIPGSDWRWFAGVCAIPAFTAFLLALFIIPESPRFSIEKLNFDEAAAALNRLSSLKTTAQELKIEYYMNKSDDGIFEGTKVEVKASNVPIMFSTKKMIRTSITLMVIWFTLSFGSYGISTWITTIFNKIGEINSYEGAFIFALANLPGNLVSILLVDKYGRKKLLFFGMLLAGLCSIGFAILSTRKDMNGQIVFCAAAFNAFSVIGWNSLDCLSVEMFPTAVRTSAMGFLAGSGECQFISTRRLSFIRTHSTHRLCSMMYPKLLHYMYEMYYSMNRC
jgi:MFS family permease